MKTIFSNGLFLVLCSFFIPLSAQRPWNYSTLQEIRLDDAYFVDPPAALKAKIAQYTEKTEVPYNILYRLSVSCNKNGIHQVLFQSDSIVFTIPEPLASELLPYLVSDRYWRERYRQLQDWAFVNMDNHYMIDVDTSNHRYGHFSPVTWLDYHYQPSSEWPVSFTSAPTITNRKFSACQSSSGWQSGAHSPPMRG